MSRFRVRTAAAIAAVCAVTLATIGIAAAQPTPGGTGSPVSVCANPVVDANLNGWSAKGTGAAGSRVAVGGHVAADFAYFQSRANGANPEMFLPRKNTAAGDRWTMAIDTWVDGPPNNVTVRMQVDWRNAAGAIISRSNGPEVPVTGGPQENWTRIAGDFTAPAGATRADPSARLAAPAGVSWVATACDYRPIVSSPPPPPPPTTTTAAPPPTTTTTTATTTATQPPPGGGTGTVPAAGNGCPNPVLAANADGWSQRTGPGFSTREPVTDHVVAQWAFQHNNQGHPDPQVNLPPATVTAGAAQNFAVDMRFSAASRVRLEAEWYNAAGTYLFRSDGPYVDVAGGSPAPWRRIETGPITVPAGATRADIVARASVPVNNAWALTACDYPAAGGTPPPTTTTTAAPPPTTTTAPPPTTTTAPPPPPTTTTAPPPPPGGSVLWNGDFETGDLSQYIAEAVTAQGAGVPAQVVQNPVRKGNHAAKFSITGPSGGGVSRSEISPNVYPNDPENANHFFEGDEFWFGHSLYFENVPTNLDQWQILFNWHHHGCCGSVPVEAFVGQSFPGDVNIGGNQSHTQGGQYWERSLGPATPGVWIDFQTRIKFSTQTGVGSIEVWRNGVNVMPTFFPVGGTLYPEPEIGTWDFWKFGYYRDGNIAQPATVYYDEVKVGTTRGSVTP